MKQSYTLSNGTQIPSTIFGTWTFDESAVQKAMGNAIKAGYRGIDTAAYYQNEKGIGIAVHNSDIRREDLFISSKVWRTEAGYQKAKKAICDSLFRLNTDYLDLMLIHWPSVKTDNSNWEEINLSTWRALEEFYDKGKLKAIGVSNFREEHLEIILEKGNVQPMVNQIEVHPGFGQHGLVEFCKSKGIIVEAWSPFGRGEALDNKIIKDISKKHNISSAQTILCWIRQQSVIPIVKATSLDHLRENLVDPGILLSESEMQEIYGIGFFGRLGYDPNRIKFSDDSRYQTFTAMKT